MTIVLLFVSFLINQRRLELKIVRLLREADIVADLTNTICKISQERNLLLDGKNIANTTRIKGQCLRIFDGFFHCSCVCSEKNNLKILCMSVGKFLILCRKSLFYFLIYARKLASITP